MRLDILMTEKKIVKSRKVAHDLIKSGKVSINGEIILKPAKDILDNAEIIISEQPKYVGRGGLKLEKALVEFKINPTNLIILDVGSSTGGFTDCLIQRGAKKIYAVDVGTDQLDAKLKNNPQIISLEKTDIRNIQNLPEKPDLAVIDVSFISLVLILKKVSDLLKAKAKIIALIKPQFETKKEDKNKSGIVKNDEIRAKVLRNIRIYSQKNKLGVLNIIDSPILGGSGNKEYLLLLQKNI
jgi:23S rRNA (cytidine1920-2'-O)/16S rRNA (cytidine1409-2'-O)-methyltransferase